MKKSKLIILLIILTIAGIIGEYLVEQHIEDNKRLAPEINDTSEMNKYYDLILTPFKVPLIVTITELVYEILVILGLINKWDWFEDKFD
jgi:hypothetical protein